MRADRQAVDPSGLSLAAKAANLDHHGYGGSRAREADWPGSARPLRRGDPAGGPAARRVARCRTAIDVARW